MDFGKKGEFDEFKTKSTGALQRQEYGQAAYVVRRRCTNYETAD
jgi:hypothetical protein